MALYLLLPVCRFNPKQQPSAEWAVFGSYLFLLPQLEVVEGEGDIIMALNVAWDARWVATTRSEGKGKGKADS
jgi:hypothetical protein